MADVGRWIVLDWFARTLRLGPLMCAWWLWQVLQEARGRCGEYSMVFYHLMRALGYTTRS